MRSVNDQRITNDMTERDDEFIQSSTLRLPPIGKNLVKNYPGQRGVSKTPVELNENNEIALKHNLSLKLESISKEILQSLHRSLQLSDNRNNGVQTVQAIQYQMKRYHIPISTEVLNQLMSKYTSQKYPGLVDYNKMMGYLIQIKKLPVLNIAQQSFGTRARKNASWESNKRSYLRQEEMPILEELKRQFQESSVDVAMLYLHANEIDRGFRGVLNKSQVKKLLTRSGVHISENLLDSMLHYCDRDGYRLYSIDKLLDYFDRAVQENRSLVRLVHNRRPVPTSRVPSPSSPSPPPILERSTTPVFTSPPITFENVEFEEIEPMFDREEWLKRFNFMVRAIYNCHQDRPGFLTVDEVEHIAQTYNLVYNLDIPNAVIGQCVTQSFNNQLYLVDIRQFVHLLQTLCLQLAKFK